MVVPGDPFQPCQFDGFPCFPRGAPMNQFRLVQAVDRFSQRIIVAVAPAADRRLDASLSQPFHRDGSGARPLIAFTAFGQQRGDMGNRRRSTAPLSRIRWKASAMSRICGPSTVTEDDELEIMARPIGRKVFNCHHETTGIRSTQLIPAKPGRHPDRTDRRSPRHQDHRRRADRRRLRDGQPVAPNHPRIPKDTPAPGFAALLTIRLHLSLLQGVGIE